VKVDDPGRHAAALLEALQDAMQRLGQVHAHYVRLGTAPARPFLTLSGRPFSVHEDGSARRFHGSIALGLHVTGADGREYELAVDVLWDAERWTITTEAWVEADAGGQDLLRRLPERSATELRVCIEQLAAAVGDLEGFDDLVPRKSPLPESG
jgi:hypothetical protein